MTPRAPGRAARPAPTVRPPRGRAAWLTRAAMLPLIGGVFLAAIAVAARRYGDAVLLTILGCALAAPFLLAAGIAAAQRMRFNPWPAALALTVLAGLVGWLLLPALGLGFARYLMPVLLWPCWRQRGAWLRYRRRSNAYRRWAQALAPVLAQSSGQVEQVLAGLTGTARPERVTDPHFGAAPGAAWSLRVTRWHENRIRVAVLRLPAHPDISGVDFLAKVKDALARRVPEPHTSLRVDETRDEITVTVTDGPAEEADDRPTTADRASERVRTAAGMLLKGVQVTAMAIDDSVDVPAGAGTAGVGQAITEFTVTYDPAKVVTPEAQRAQITAHLSTQLFGAPDQLRATWRVDQDKVTFRRRREFPTLIPAPALTPSQVRALFGERITLAWGEDEDGNPTGYPLNKTTLPHGMVIGPTGGGKTQLLLLLIMRAAALGVESWLADPKMIELMGLRGWPGVTRVATKVPDMIKVVGDAHKEMYKRFDDISAGRKKLGDFKRLMIVLDEYFVFCMLVGTWWAAQPKTKEDPKTHPVFQQIAELLALSRGADINVVIGIQRPDATFFPDGARDNIGWRVALGRLSAQGANMVFGDYHTGTDLPLDVPGLCTATTANGPARCKVHYVPNPAHALTGSLSDEDMAHLRSLLPAGTTWDGPLPADAPDPGFEDSAAAAEAVTIDPVTGFLLLLRMALSSQTAHLTAVPGGGMPDAADPARYGWGPGPGGRPQAGGAFIGSVEQTKTGRRVYLHPDSAYDVAARFAAELTEDFDLDRQQLDDALRASGLLATEGAAADGTRYTVRRNLPGSGLPGEARKRVWDIPEEALLGEPLAPVPPPPAGVRLPDETPQSTAPPVQPPAQAAARPARRLGPADRDAADLTENDQVVLYFEGGEVVRAIVLSLVDDPENDTDPEPDGVPRFILHYLCDQGADSVLVRADDKIRLQEPS